MFSHRKKKFYYIIDGHDQVTNFTCDHPYWLLKFHRLNVSNTLYKILYICPNCERVSGPNGIDSDFLFRNQLRVFEDKIPSIEFV